MKELILEIDLAFVPQASQIGLTTATALALIICREKGFLCYFSASNFYLCYSLHFFHLCKLGAQAKAVSQSWGHSPTCPEFINHPN